MEASMANDHVKVQSRNVQSPPSVGSNEVPAILAVDPPADRRSDGGDNRGEASPIAPPARTSRRSFLVNSIMSGASLASAIGTATAVEASTTVSPPLPVAIAASAEPDPILGVIERYHSALLLRFETGHVFARTSPEDSNYDAVYEDSEDAMERLTDAQLELASTVPTTLAGVVALLSYVKRHHHQEFVLPENPRHWYSTEYFFESFQDEELLDRFNREPLVFSL
jgi:hypothetical protein